MGYYIIADDSYIYGIGEGSSGNQITEEKYQEILSLIKDKPQAPAGYDYHLRVDLTWEQYERPVEPIEPEEATEEDYREALEMLGVI